MVRQLPSLFLCALPALVCGCGSGTFGIFAASDSSSSSGNAGTVGSDLEATNATQDARPDTSPAHVSFVLTDQEGDAADCVISFSVGGSVPREITLAPGSSDLTQVPSGGSHTVLWDFVTDLGNESYRSDVSLRLDVVGGNTTEVAAPIGNTAPVILYAMPPLEDESTGVVPIAFEVADNASDRVKVTAEYVVAGQAPRPATVSGADLNGLETTPLGLPYTFVWNSGADLSGDEVNVRLLLTAEDIPFEKQGAPASTEEFRVDNNDPPRVLFDNALFVNNPDDTRGIPIPFSLTDAEEDAVRMVVQWRREGQSFPSLPSSVAEIEAILSDPVRREEKQIGTELPLVYGGRTAATLPGSDPMTRIVLPELASSAANLLAGGLEGRSLELLRPSTIPGPLDADWAEHPVAALPVGSGPTALVLDSPSNDGWRLREVDLASGEIVDARIATGPGSPTAIDYEPERKSAIVASNSGARWQVHRVLLSDWTVKPLITSDDGATEDGPIRGIASLGSGAAVITVGSSLVRLSFAVPPQTPTGGFPSGVPPRSQEAPELEEAPGRPLDVSPPSRAVTLLDDLATPWGLETDPLQADRIYVAERDGVGAGGGVGRVIRVELDTYVIEDVFVRAETLPTEGIERPTAIALERNGARLLAVTDANPADGSRELRAVDIGGSQTGVVFELASELPGDTRGLAVGPDALRLLALPSANDLAAGGGVLQRRTVEGYDPDTREVTVAEAFDPEPVPNNPWRMRAELGLAASDLTGRANVFVWDSRDVLEGNIALRIVPLDTDIGLGVEGLAEKRIRSFQDPVTVGLVSEKVQSVVAADLNDDGWLDLAAATFTPGPSPDVLTIHYQKAPGVFIDPARPEVTPDVTLGGADTSTRAPHQIVAVDLNGDGLLDIASSNEGNMFNSSINDLGIFFQPETGGFTDKLLPDVTLGQELDFEIIEKPIGLEAADLNGNGLLDLAMANTISGTVTVFFQESPGLFDPVPSLLGGGRIAGRAVQVETADLNADGRLDLACATHEPFEGVGGVGFLSIFLQTGPRQFLRSPVRPSTGVASTDVLVADLDADGDIDLASANRPTDGFGSSVAGDHTITLHPQEQGAPGHFPEQPELVLQEASSIEFPVNLVAADLNANGRLDLISSNQETDNLTVFLRDSQGRFPTTPDFALGGTGALNQPQHHEAVDLNGDGRLDLITASLSSGRAVFLHSAPGGFASVVDLELGTSASTDRVQAIVAADLNGDGLTDLASANRESNGLALFFQGAAGRFTAAPDLVLGNADVNNPVPNAPVDLTAADLDGDGLLDLVSANENGNDLSLFIQTAQGEFPTTPLRLGGLFSTLRPRSVVAADLNGDGRLDVAAGNSRGLTVFFQPHTGFGNGMQPDVVVLGGFQADTLKAADLNGDGCTDLVSGNQLSGTLTVFLQPDRGFVAGAPPDVVLGEGVLEVPESVVAADLDGNGRLDLVAGDSNRGRLWVFLQPDTGFEPRPAPDFWLPTHATPRSLVAADLNSDGLLDLASANQGAQDVTVFFQTSRGLFSASSDIPASPDLVLGGPDILGGSGGAQDNGPVSIVAADLNSDGELDLAAAFLGGTTTFGNSFDRIALFFGGK